MDIVESIKKAKNPVLLVGSAGSGKTNYAEQVLAEYPKDKKDRMNSHSFLTCCEKGFMKENQIVVIDEIPNREQIIQVLFASIGKEFKVVMITQLPPEKIPLIVLDKCEIIKVPKKSN